MSDKTKAPRSSFPSIIRVSHGPCGVDGLASDTVHNGDPQCNDDDDSTSTPTTDCVAIPARAEARS